MVTVLIMLYVLSIIATYYVQRLILKVSNNSKYHPVGFMIFIMFVPFVGLVASALILLMEIPNSDIIREKFYKIK